MLEDEKSQAIAYDSEANEYLKVRLQKLQKSKIIIGESCHGSLDAWTYKKIQVKRGNNPFNYWIAW